MLPAGRLSSNILGKYLAQIWRSSEGKKLKLVLYVPEVTIAEKGANVALSHASVPFQTFPLTVHGGCSTLR